jgi:hypothetical protein
VGRVVLDIDVALDAEPAAEENTQVTVRRAVGPVTLETRLPDPTSLHRLVLIHKRPPDLVVTLEAGLLDRVPREHPAMFFPVRIVTVGALHPPLEERMVRELAQLGHLMAVAGGA